MKNTVVALACFIFALIGRAEDDDGFNLYEPEGGWKGGKAGMVSVTDLWDGGDRLFAVDRDGSSQGFDEYIDQLKNTEGWELVAPAYESLREALKAQVMAKNTSDNLNSLLSKDGLEITGTDEYGKSVKYRIKIPNLKDAVEGGDSYIPSEKVNEEEKTYKDSTTVQYIESSVGNNFGFHIVGWEDAKASGMSIADILMSPEGTGDAENVLVPVRENYTQGNNFGVQHNIGYHKIGRINALVRPDELTVTTNFNNGGLQNGELSLKGVREASAEKSDICLPFIEDRVSLDQGGETSKGLQWKALSAMLDSDALEVHVEESGDQSGYGLVSIKGLHDNDDAGDEKPVVLTRQGKGEDAAVAWTNLDFAAEYDDLTITTNEEYGALHSGEVSLCGYTDGLYKLENYGMPVLPYLDPSDSGGDSAAPLRWKGLDLFVDLKTLDVGEIDTATEGLISLMGYTEAQAACRGSNNPWIPFIDDGSGGLLWSDLSGFFTGAFSASPRGDICLACGVDGAKKIMSVTGTGDGQTAAADDVSEFLFGGSFDTRVPRDANVAKAELKGLGAAAVGDFPVKYEAGTDGGSGGTVGWRSFGDVVDGLSLGVVPNTGGNGARLEIRGASAVNGRGVYYGTPVTGGGALGWYRLPESAGGMALDDVTVATNESGQVGFKGWEGFGRGFLGRTEDGRLACKALVETNGLCKVAESDALYGEYKIGLDKWDDPSGCDENLSKLLTDASQASADDRLHHRILTRYDGRSPASVHWLPIGDVIDTGAEVDAVSITTNAAGKASVYGFGSAAEGDVPVRRGSVVRWEPPSGGGVIRFVGTDGTSRTVGSGGSTNTVTFASASDSNVRISVGGIDGNITITFGVYYK